MGVSPINECGQAELLNGGDDLARDRLGRAHIERAARNFAIEHGAPHRTPATFGADAVAHALVVVPLRMQYRSSSPVLNHPAIRTLVQAAMCPDGHTANFRKKDQLWLALELQNRLGLLTC